MALHRLVYLAYGNDGIRYQALYSALSALAWRSNDDVQLHVVTDAPEAFARLGELAHFIRVTPERLAGWRGPCDYIHRIKPAVLRDAMDWFPGERVALIDADTYFTAPVGALFDGLDERSIAMWEREYHVGSHDTMMMWRFRRRTRGCTFRGAPVSVDVNMWNSGVVAIPTALRPLVDDWLAFLDEVFPRSRRWVLEQFALAWLAQRDGIRLVEKKHVLAHYYLQKPEHLEAIRKFLARTVALPLDDVLSELRRSPFRLPPPPPEKPRKKPNVFQRVFGW